MPKLTPVTRLSLGIVMLTLSVLLAADWLGLTPDQNTAWLDARKKFAESLAVQLSKLAERHQDDISKVVVDAVRDRNEDVVSISLRKSNGTILAETSGHDGHWADASRIESTPTHVLVPIYNHNDRWGHVEIMFKPLAPWTLFGLPVSRLLALVLFVGLASYVLYHIFLRRSLRYLDPAAVIPERVQSAFDALAEGVLILDDEERIVLANTAFAEKTGHEMSTLLGRRPNDLKWRSRDQKSQQHELPWTHAIHAKAACTAVPLQLKTRNQGVRTFMVNAAPVVGADGAPRGAMTTFDDVTRLEKKNTQLQEMLDILKRSQAEVKRKNEELQILATEDALTGCMNRRAFFAVLEERFARARHKGETIACIMLDIDHFKSVNDHYGHPVGDRVIRAIADTLKRVHRKGDPVCRLGGEEFCLLMSDSNANAAYALAQRIRMEILGQRFDDDPATADLRVTSSFGVAESGPLTTTSSDLIDHADQALYAAKDAGRNRVMRWGDTLSLPPPQETQASGAEPTQTSAATPEPASTGEVVELQARDDVDQLTGLPGRIRFLDDVRRTISADSRNSVALMVVDLDMFKRINNFLGHDHGDRVLKEICAHISEVVRHTDVLARIGKHHSGVELSRLGGDEFGLLLRDLPNEQRIDEVAARINKVVSEHPIVRTNNIRLTCSVGVSVWAGGSEHAEVLLKKAELAMYAAKANGGNTFQRYSEEINDSFSQDLQFEQDLREALNKNQFMLHYQPKVDLASGEIVAMEALLRWKHPTRGIIPPKTFVPIAESTGLIREIGIWVLRTACVHAKTWVREGNDKLRVAVNLSILQLRDKQLIRQMIGILEETGLAPHNLEIELTENSIMENLDLVSTFLEELQKLGVQVALDDFGIGYSSMNYIKRFPLNALKIDRAFIQNLDTDTHDLAIVSSVVNMAHAMGLAVTAEGVENQQQLEILRSIHCDLVQGHIYSRPKPFEEASRLLHPAELSRPLLNVVGDGTGN
ncbi:MAG: diguanylate cyclase [Pseudomonadota bacterium]|nr:MAG: diguanylate cyclase [Pseudomonadota bacterium]